MTITGKETRLVRIERGDCKCGTEVTVLSVELDDRPGTILDANIDGIVLAIPYMDAADCLEHEVVYICDDCVLKLYVERQKGSIMDDAEVGRWVCEAFKCGEPDHTECPTRSERDVTAAKRLVGRAFRQVRDIIIEARDENTDGGNECLVWSVLNDLVEEIDGQQKGLDE